MLLYFENGHCYFSDSFIKKKGILIKMPWSIILVQELF